MRYVGGKGKIARQLADVIAASTDAETVYEPFMGGGAMTAELAGRFTEVIAGDAMEDIAMMWQQVIAGWDPHPVTESEYRDLRASAEASAIRGFAGSGCSFGGKWFGGFARGGFNADGTPRNHQAESVRAVGRVAAKLRAGNVHVFHKTFLAWPLDCGLRAAIYCDPPYASSGSGGQYAPEFSSAEFWAWADLMSHRHDVFVSEYEAPPGWVSIWEGRKRQSLVIGSGVRDVRVERLWVREGSRAHLARQESQP